MTGIRKVFAYVVRGVVEGAPELLAFESHDEPGLEVPKGTVESGESLEGAALRELHEETGVTDARTLRELGTADWCGETQHFLLIEAPPGVPLRFEHTVTGDGADAGLVYRYRWLPIDAALQRRLVQGGDRFVAELREAVGARWRTSTVPETPARRARDTVPTGSVVDAVAATQARLRRPE